MPYSVEKIIKVFEKANITKMELEVEGIKIKLEKNTSSEEIKTEVVKVNQNISTTEVIQTQETNTNYNEVTSPVVGILHLQKDPNSKPFVEIGSIVKKGDVLCIVEAMKVMNEIRSLYDGVVKSVNLPNGSIVEYNQSIFSIGNE